MYSPSSGKEMNMVGVWPLNGFNVALPVWRSQIRIVQSNETEVISAEYAPRTASTSLLSLIFGFMFPELNCTMYEQEIKYLPSGENETEVTIDMCASNGKFNTASPVLTSQSRTQSYDSEMM